MRRFAAVLLFLCSVSAFAANVSDAVKKYGDLHLGETKSAPVTITVGHATFTADTASVVLAGSDPVGLFLGKGTFTYDSPNKDEHVALRYNARGGKVKLTGPEKDAEKLTIQEPFKGALLIGNGLPALTGATTAAADWKSHRDLFERNSFIAPPEHLFALQAIDAPASRVVRAEIDSPSRPYVYLYDDALTHMETLDYLRAGDKSGSKTFDGVLWPRALSEQAIGRDNRDTPPARMRLVDVDVNLTGKMNEEGTLTVVETLVPQLRPAAAIHFDLQKYIYFDAHREPRRYNLRKVVDAEGHELDFVHENDDLVVALAKPAPVGQPFKLRFEIDGDFLYRQDKTNFWELGITPWFPWLQMHEQGYTFHAVVKTEKPFVAFASGKTIRREEEGDYNVIETKLDQPVGWVSILGGKYQFDEETRNGVTVRVASFIIKNKDAYKKLRNIAFAAINFYPTFLGPFPYEELNVIEKADAFGYGQAPAGIVFITGEAFTPMLGEANEYIKGINHRFAHEIAHAYWGGVVRMPSRREQWIDEAFADYSAALFMKTGKKEYYDQRFIEWKSEAKDALQTGTIATANQLSGDPMLTFRNRNGLIYYKGAYLLAALHEELGDVQFLTFLKSYQKNFRGKYGTTKNVMALLKFMTNKDYGPWFEENFYGTGLPDVKRK
jgi:hypothetical protein